MARREEAVSPYAGVAWVPRRRNLWLGGAFALLVVLGVPLATRGHHAEWLAVLTALAAVGVLAGTWAAFKRYRQEIVGRVEARRDGLFLSERALVKRGTVDAVHVVEDDDGFWFVHIFVRLGGVVTVGVEDKDEGIALTRALQLDARSMTARFLLTRREYSKPALLAPLFLPPLGMLVVLLHPPTVVALVVPLVMLLIATLVLASRTLRVVIGADGVHVREGLGRTRFIGHGAVESVERAGATVVLRLHGGEELRWPMAFAGARTEDTDEEGMAEGMKRRIDEARRVFAVMAGDVSAVPALARAGREAKDWLEILRRIGEETDGGLRDSVVGRARLWDLVEGSSTPAAARVAAAVALRVAALANDGTRTRIAEIAEACASPALGARIRVAAEGDEGALVGLLEGVEDTSPRTARAR